MIIDDVQLYIHPESQATKNTYIYIYIYIERERERESLHMYNHVRT